MTESSWGGKPSGRVMEEMGKGEEGGRKAKMYLLYHSLDESCEGGLWLFKTVDARHGVALFYFWVRSLAAVALGWPGNTVEMVAISAISATSLYLQIDDQTPGMQRSCQ